MTPLVYSGETAFCLTMIIYLFAAFVGAVCFAMSLSYRLKLQFVLPEVGVSAAALMLFCVFADGIAIRRFGADPGEYAGSPCFMPLWSVVLIGLTLFTLAAAWLVLVVKKRLSGLTAMSVKEAIAALPTALCFYDETGRLLLLNDRIERDCREITGEPLYDGNAFWAAISGEEKNGIGITRSEGSVIVENRDGRAVCYKRIAHDFGGKTVYELSGTDISREFALKKETEQKNENLRKMNLRLRKYGEIVAEVTKERETLAARVKVHANLGSLILRTKKSLARGETDRETLVSEWNDVTSLIFASGEEEDKFAGSGQNGFERGRAHFLRRKTPPKRFCRRKNIRRGGVRVRGKHRSPRRRHRTLRKNDGQRNRTFGLYRRQRQKNDRRNNRGRRTFVAQNDDRKRRRTNGRFGRAAIYAYDNDPQGEPHE